MVRDLPALRHSRLVAKVAAIKGDKRKADEVLELCSERMQLHETWIAKKQGCRANIKMLPTSAAVLKEKILKDYQEDFREIDAEFKALGVMQDRANLLEGAVAARRDNPAKRTNTELLEGALSTQQSTTGKLRVRRRGVRARILPFDCHRATPPRAAGGARDCGVDSGGCALHGSAA